MLSKYDKKAASKTNCKSRVEIPRSLEFQKSFANLFSRDKLHSRKRGGHSFRPMRFLELAWSDPKSFWKFKKTFLEKVSFHCSFFRTLKFYK